MSFVTSLCIHVHLHSTTGMARRLFKGGKSRGISEKPQLTRIRRRRKKLAETFHVVIHLYYMTM